MNDSVFDPQFQNQSIEARIVVALERISESFRVLLWKESKEIKLSPIQIQILIFLYFHPEEKRKVSYLAKEFSLTKATISEATRTLFKKELIEKNIEAQDHRSYTINLSPKGQQITEQLTSYANNLIQPLSELTENQKFILFNSLTELIHKLYKAGIIQMQRMCFTCGYYEKNESGSFCKLLQRELEETELRLDCPEHKPLD